MRQENREEGVLFIFFIVIKEYNVLEYVQYYDDQCYES